MEKHWNPMKFQCFFCYNEENDLQKEAVAWMRSMTFTMPCNSVTMC